MSLSSFSAKFLPALENQLKNVIALVDGDRYGQLHTILEYHMGWQETSSATKASGKRIRPLLLLLTCEAAGGAWKKALPAASAVELVHNFSLMHDDIEDNSPLRRGRETVWKRWGVAQALNAGDAMFTLAHTVMLQLSQTSTLTTSIEGARILQESCLKLTQGQFLDISYEGQNQLTIEDYWPMVSGKTAALLAACTELGALIAGVTLERQTSFREFGHHLGLAFQVQDDLLGVWGDVALTGKSAESDLLTGKKSLPVLYGLSQRGEFGRRWLQGAVQAEEVPLLAKQLESEGGRGYTQTIANQLTEQALIHLQSAQPQGDAGKALRDLADLLLNRYS